MVTLVESPRAAFVSGSSLPASSPFRLYRLMLPALCVLIGISVGSATGLTLALVNASRNSVAASTEDSAEISTPPSSNLAANASPAQTTQAAVEPAPIVAPDTSAAQTTASSNPEKATPKLHSAPESVSPSVIAPSKVQVALNQAPDALKPASFKLDGKEYRAAKMTFVPNPNPEEQAAKLPARPSALNPTQWSLDTPPSASLYTEGVLTVSDYSPTTRTIETSDGKTFVLGTTVASGNATSWDTYRSDVHYRCDQNGSCVLMRAGVVAPDARLI